MSGSRLLPFVSATTRTPAPAIAAAAAASSAAPAVDPGAAALMLAPVPVFALVHVPVLVLAMILQASCRISARWTGMLLNASSTTGSAVSAGRFVTLTRRPLATVASITCSAPRSLQPAAAAAPPPPPVPCPCQRCWPRSLPPPTQVDGATDASARLFVLLVRHAHWRGNVESCLTVCLTAAQSSSASSEKQRALLPLWACLPLP